MANTNTNRNIIEPENPGKRVDQLFQVGTESLAGEAVDKEVERAGDEDNDDVDDDGEEDYLSLLFLL